MFTTRFAIIIVILSGLLMFDVSCKSDDKLADALEEAWEFKNAGEFEQAEKAYKRAISISRKKYGSDNTREADYLCILGMMYVENGRIEEGEIVLHKSLNIFKDKGKTDDHIALLALNSLAIAYKMGEKYTEAESLFTYLINNNNYNSVMCNKPIIHSNLLYLLAETNIYLGRMPRAESLLLDYTSSYTNSPYRDIDDLLYAYLYLANLYGEQSRYSELEQIMTELINIADSVYNDDNTQKIHYRLYMSMICERFYDTNKADSIYYNTIELLKQVYGNDPEGIAQICEYLEASYKKQDMKDKASIFAQKAINIRSAIEQDSIPNPDDLNLYINR
ncbi:MAG: tetratricopeptide repeat protein [candidate division Zixibacteria bacterium]|nr:tetratricopeptide repeat protein [candidate division Zixibacteria bacterium]